VRPWISSQSLTPPRSGSLREVFASTRFQPTTCARRYYIADAVGLGAAIDYVSRVGMERIAEYEHQLLLYAMRL
jgi:selenocysteine lyase/cysteine desulfurase